MKVSVTDRGIHGWCATASDDTGMVDSTSGHATADEAIERLTEKVQKRIEKARTDLTWYEMAIDAIREKQKRGH